MSLLLDIFRCPNVRMCLENPQLEHPCSQIVSSQESVSMDDHQMPEPWMGNLAKAPILFLGSNPSIGTDHEYPAWSAPDDEVEDYFDNHFGNGRKEWTKDGVYYLRTDGKPRKVLYWTEVKKRAVELLEHNDVRAGIDYALSEVVLCKSKGQKGVKQAVEECASRYLPRIVGESESRVIVSLGKFAERTVRNTFGINDEVKVEGPVDVARRERWFTFLPHPAAWTTNLGVSFEGNLSPQEITQLRDVLK